MKKFLCLVMVFLFSFTFISACGPSEEAIATMTAAAWTPTPEPTLTPTPVPYDLDVTLEGEDGERVFYGAYVAATEQEEVMADETGKAVLMNLPGPEVEVSVTAQGYEPYTETVTLEHGKNAKTFSLIADPLQVNPASACLEGQERVLSEDFEDGKMQNGEGQFMRPLFDFVEIADRGTVLKVDRTMEGEAYLTYPEILGNMVWHYDLLREPGNGPMWMRFHQENDRGAYIAVHFGNADFFLQREPGGSMGYRTVPPGDGETWEQFSATYFDGTIEAWYNGELHIGVSDGEPYEDGFQSISLAVSEGSTFLDNLVICELSEPYTPPVVEEEVEKKKVESDPTNRRPPLRRPFYI